MRTILVVDDSPTIRRMVKASLAALAAPAGAAGAAVVEATSGLEAIEVLALNAVSAIVLDLNMPDMHGLDVLRFVRGHARHGALPVLVLTTRDDATSREAAMQAGASAYMTKPFSPAALVAAVTELLSHADAESAR